MEAPRRTGAVVQAAGLGAAGGTAAGALAVEEAGGRVTDLEGKKLDFGAGLTLARNPGLLSTNGIFHEAVLEALQKVTLL